MKKLSKYLLVIMLSLFIIPLVNVNATSLNVKTINASISDNKISVDGTVDNGVLAVAIMVYDEAGTNLLKMQTTAVEDNDSFKDTITIKNGTYVVKAANYDGGTYITKTVAPTVTGITLNKTSATIEVGKTLKLKATLAPEGTLDTVKWTTDNAKVATVIDGVVTAKGPGIATITATVNGISATCKVTVPKGETILDVPTLDPKEEVKDVTVGVKIDNKTENMLIESVDTTLKTKIDNAVSNGKDVETKVNVEKINVTQVDTKTKKDITKIEDTAKNEGLKVVLYLDLSVAVISDGNELGKITETKKPLTFQVAVPEDLKKDGRVFQVVRVHDGVVTVLDTKEENGILTFETDQFSTYALVYTDKTNTTITPEEPEKPADKNVQAGDETNMSLYASICGLAIVVGALVVLTKKREELLNK